MHNDALLLAMERAEFFATLTGMTAEREYFSIGFLIELVKRYCIIILYHAF